MDKHMPFDFFMEHFDSAEAEAITGVSQMLQRSYRARGYLPPQPGHSHYDLFDLSELAFIRAMAARGVEIKLAKRFAGWVSQGVAFHALSHDDAYAGPISLDYDLGLQAPAVLRRHSPMGPDRARVVPVRFWVLWADDTATWLSKLEGDLFEQERAKKNVGPALVFDQLAAGEALRQRAGRPLVRASGMSGTPDTANHFSMGVL